MPAQSVRIKNFRELNAAFARADKRVRREYQGELRRASEPVRAEAQELAGSRIRNVQSGDPWSKMRVGITRRSVYVAPAQRGSRSKITARTAFFGLVTTGFNLGTRRPNLAGLLMDRAMQPALDNNLGEVEDRINDWLDDVERDWGRGG